MKNRLKELRERSGLSQQALADKIGTTQPTIVKLQNGRMRMTTDWIEKLAPALGVEPRDLLPPFTDDEIARRPEGENIPVNKPESLAKSTDSIRIDTPRLVEDANDLIPIRSAARGGLGQVMFLSDGPLDWTRRPSVLRNVVDAYAIYMVGESMVEMYHPGWLLYVNPNRPPVRGRGICITFNTDEVRVKLFERWEDDELVVKQLSPPEELRFKVSDIRYAHRIMGSVEE